MLSFRLGRDLKYTFCTIQMQIIIIQIKIVMKQVEKLKKQKSPLIKIPLNNKKNTEPKKNTLKQGQPNIPKPLSFQPTPKINTAYLTGTQSTKQLHQINPLISMKNSPKASLGETKQLVKGPAKVKKVELAQKNKEEIKKSLANVIKVYYPQKKNCLDISMTEKTKDTTEKEDKLCRNDFNWLDVIGEGGYGKVWKVEMVKSKRCFAMKQMSKALIMMKKSVENVLNERKILQEINSGFIANMVCAFNDRDNLYLVMDLLPGADLRYKITYLSKFAQDQSKFLIACILTALQYVHKKKIFHRDIKPENLVFDEQGYLRLTDFGIARSERSKQSLDASGTPGYMAPQVLNRQIHSYEVDYYAVGIVAHELMMGKRPYSGTNRLEIRDAVLSKQHIIKKSQIPPGWSVEAADFVNKLIIRNASCRLGSKNGIKQIKGHGWLSGFKWQQLQSKKMKSPFRSKQKAMLMTERNEDLNQQELMQYKLVQRAQSKMDAFAKYYYQLSEK